MTSLPASSAEAQCRDGSVSFVRDFPPTHPAGGRGPGQTAREILAVRDITFCRYLTYRLSWVPASAGMGGVGLEVICND